MSGLSARFKYNKAGAKKFYRSPFFLFIDLIGPEMNPTFFDCRVIYRFVYFRWLITHTTRGKLERVRVLSDAGIQPHHKTCYTTKKQAFVYNKNRKLEIKVEWRGRAHVKQMRGEKVFFSAMEGLTCKITQVHS